MGFRCAGQVEFRDTDAAGVVYFANVLAFCHRAYEGSLAASGITLRRFFSGHPLAYPITRTTLDLSRPMFPGDPYVVQLTPQITAEDTFAISYQIWPGEEVESVTGKPIATAWTQHVCIDPQSRQRHSLPEEIHHWSRQWQDGADG